VTKPMSAPGAAGYCALCGHANCECPPRPPVAEYFGLRARAEHRDDLEIIELPESPRTVINLRAHGRVIE
jgi:hypothetical protein